MNPLKHNSAGFVLVTDEPLGPENINAFFSQQCSNPLIELFRINIALTLYGDGTNLIVMLARALLAHTLTRTLTRTLALTRTLTRTLAHSLTRFGGGWLGFS